MKKLFSGIAIILAYLFISVSWACGSQSLSNEISFESPLNAVMLDSADINHVADIGDLNKVSENMSQTQAGVTQTATEMDQVYNRLEALYDRLQTSDRVSEQIKAKLYGDNVTGIDASTEKPPAPQGLIARLNLCLDCIDTTQASLAENLDSIRNSV